MTHNNDGSKSIGFSFSVTDNSGQSYTCGNASASGSMALSTIARKSTINSVFGENIEDYFSVTYTSYYSKFTNKLRISIPNVIALETFNYSSGTTFKLSDTTISYLYNYMKRSKTVTLGFVIETWNGNTKIGDSVELNKTCTITNCEPQIESCSYLDTNAETVAVTENNQTIVRHLSTLKINLTNLTSYKGAELSSCVVTINNISKSFSDISGTEIESVSLDFGTLDVSEDTTATIILTDTRGYTATVELQITIIDYTILSISATVKRTQPTTGEVDVEFSGNYYNGNIGNTQNTLSIKWYYREKYEEEWTEGGTLEPVIDNNTYNNGNSAISLGNIFDYQKTYEFYLDVKDKLITLQPKFTVTQGIPIFNWGKDFFNVNEDIRYKNQSLLELIFPIGSTYITQEDINPSTILGFGEWERLKGKVLVGLDEDDEDGYFDEIGKTGGEITQDLRALIGATHSTPSRIGYHIAGKVSGVGYNYSIQGSDLIRDTPTDKINHSTLVLKSDSSSPTTVQPYEVVGYMWKRTE